MELESALLELNETPTDKELVQRAFRALHTLKGSGSMFGFVKVATFAHGLENAFDEVREGRLHATAELIDLSLAALDHIKLMMDEAAGGAVADDRITEKIATKLEQLTGRATPNLKAVLPDVPLVLSGASSEIVREWHIHFAPSADFFQNGSDPLLLLRELNTLGTVSGIVDLAALPSVAELDPDKCCMSWDLILTSSAGAETIRDVFIFVEDTCELVVESVSTLQSLSGGPGVEASARIATPEAPEEQRKFGRRADDNTTSIRVPPAKLDQFVDLVGELVTVQARLSEIATHSDDSELLAVSEEVERLTSALRENSMSIRMLPIRGTFERFRRLVHDLARDLGKDVNLVIEGGETELDKTVIDQLNDPLMHLIRNSMDHGIETPSQRIAAGKQPMATVKLSARHSGANVLIVVSDDGGGIHAEAVRARAIEKGLIRADAVLREPEIFSLIFNAGFSTSQVVTDVSGRGVGMDVVRQRVEALRGTIDVSSKPGIGTSVTLCLPLTLAIIDGLLVRVGEAHFVLPLAETLECIELTQQDIEKAHGKQIAYLRGEAIPYIRLRDYFEMASQRPQREQIMIAETEEGRCGFVVDEVLGDHQTVIKNLGPFYRHVQLVSGATILGNGGLALILDPNRLIQDAIRTLSLTPRRPLPVVAPAVLMPLEVGVSMQSP